MGGMTEVYEIMHRMKKQNRENLYSHGRNTRRHPVKLASSRFRIDKRRGYFTVCTIDLCNSLPQCMVMTTSIDGLKGGLNNFVEVRSVNNSWWLSGASMSRDCASWNTFVGRRAVSLLQLHCDVVLWQKPSKVCVVWKVCGQLFLKVFFLTASF